MPPSRLAAGVAARPGDDLPEVPAEGAGAAVRQRPRSWPTTWGGSCAGEPILARPTPAWERAAKWARRRPATAALVAVGLVAAIGLAVAAERYRLQREQSRRRDERFAASRLEAVDGIDLSHRQRARGKLDDARSTLSDAPDEAELQAEPRLADLVRRVEDELRDVERRLDEDAARAADLERFARFGRLRDQLLVLDGNAALFPETLVGEGDQGSSPEARTGMPRPSPSAANVP